MPPPACQEDVGALEGADCGVGPEGGVWEGGVEDYVLRLVYVQRSEGGIRKQEQERRTGIIEVVDVDSFYFIYSCR